MERGLEALSLLNDQAQGQIRGTIELVFKILSNVKASPMDQKMRCINKTGKAYQGKLLPFPAVFHFLSLCGWDN